MAQDPEQKPIRPEANGHREQGSYPPLPLPRRPPEKIEPVQQSVEKQNDEQPASQNEQPPDPQYPYGAYSSQQTQESSAPSLPVQPSYDSPEFYTQVQQQKRQVPPPVSQPPYSESPIYNPPSYGVPPTLPYRPTSGYGQGTSGATGPSQQAPYGYRPYGYNSGYRRFDFDAEPHSSPLPLGQAIRGLFAQYLAITTKPSTRAFAREIGKAKWDITWVQIIFYAIISALFSLISAIDFDANSAANTMINSADTTGLTPAAISVLHQTLIVAYNISIYGQVLLTPLTLFIGISILFLLAKAFGGRGSYLTQLYSSLLFIVPLGIAGDFVTMLLSYLPAGGSFAFLITIARLVYQCILFGIMLMPVHRLSSGRAAGVVLLLLGSVFFLACIFAFIFAAILAATIGTA